MHEEECRREGRDRVGGRRRGERADDGCEGYEREEDEHGCLDRVCTWMNPDPKSASAQLVNQSTSPKIRKQRTTIRRGGLRQIAPEVFYGLPKNKPGHKGHAREDN